MIHAPAPKRCIQCGSLECGQYACRFTAVPSAHILDLNLPLETALRYAAERGQVLQSDGARVVIAPVLLPHFTAIRGGGTARA